MTISYKVPGYAWLSVLAIMAFMAYTAYTAWVEVKKRTKKV